MKKIIICLFFSLTCVDLIADECEVHHNWKVSADRQLQCTDFHKYDLDQLTDQELSDFLEDENFRNFIINQAQVWQESDGYPQLKNTPAVFKLLLKSALEGSEIGIILWGYSSEFDILHYDLLEEYPELIDNPFFFMSVASDFDIPLKITLDERKDRLVKIISLGLDSHWKAFALFELAWLMGLSDFDKSISLLIECVEMNNEFIVDIQASCITNVSTLLNNRGRLNESKKYLESLAKAYEVDLKNPDIHELLKSNVDFWWNCEKRCWAADAYLKYAVVYNYIFTSEDTDEKLRLMKAFYNSAFTLQDRIDYIDSQNIDSDYANLLYESGYREEARRVLAESINFIKDDYPDWAITDNKKYAYDVLLSNFAELQHCLSQNNDYQNCVAIKQIKEFKELSEYLIEKYIASDAFMDSWHLLNLSLLSFIEGDFEASKNRLEDSYQTIINNSSQFDGAVYEYWIIEYIHELLRHKKRLSTSNQNISPSYLDLLEIKKLFSIEDELKKLKIKSLESSVKNKIETYQSKREEYSEIEGIMLSTGSINRNDFSKLGQLETEITKLRSSILNSNEKISLFLSNKVDNDVIRESLGQDSLLLRFDFGYNSGLAIINTNEEEDLIELQIGSYELNNLINNVLDMTEDRNGFVRLKKFDIESSYKIFLHVLEPILKMYGQKKDLIFYKSNQLLKIPPQIIVQNPYNEKGNEEWDSYRNTKWLIDDYNLSIFNSAPKNDLTEMKNKKFLGFGNPIYRDDLNLESLPSTETELINLAILSGSDIDDIFLKDRATKNNFYQRISDSYERLVISSHAIAADSKTKIDEPALVFGGDDPYLFASEIAQLDINAGWVILASCNTGVNQVNEGDSVYSLANAFLVAGAESVLLSNWEVDTNLSTKITEMMFKDTWLNKDLKKHEALSNASRKIKMDPEELKYSHPYFWGTYNIVSNEL